MARRTTRRGARGSAVRGRASWRTGPSAGRHASGRRARRHARQGLGCLGGYNRRQRLRLVDAVRSLSGRASASTTALPPACLAAAAAAAIRHSRTQARRERPTGPRRPHQGGAGRPPGLPVMPNRDAHRAGVRSENGEVQGGTDRMLEENGFYIQADQLSDRAAGHRRPAASPVAPTTTRVRWLGGRRCSSVGTASSCRAASTPWRRSRTHLSGGPPGRLRPVFRTGLGDPHGLKHEMNNSRAPCPPVLARLAVHAADGHGERPRNKSVPRTKCPCQRLCPPLPHEDVGRIDTRAIVRKQIKGALAPEKFRQQFSSVGCVSRGRECRRSARQRLLPGPRRQKSGRSTGCDMRPPVWP